MPVDGSSAGNIEIAGDTDWFKVTLTAGHAYRFDVLGAEGGNGTLADPYMELRDSAGTIIVADDDSGAGFNPQITYTPTVSGNYFVSAHAFLPSGTGTYQVSVMDEGPWGTQNIEDPAALIQAGTFFAMLSYGDANLQIGGLPAGQQYGSYDGLGDEGFDDHYADFLSAGPQLGSQWSLLSVQTGGNWTAAWITELAKWEGESGDRHAQFSEGGLYHAYIGAAFHDDQYTSGAKYKELVDYANQPSLTQPGDDAWFGNSNALVAVNDGTLVLAFRGTDSFDAALEAAQTWSGDGLYLHYEAFRPLIDTVYDYAANSANSIQHVVVSGHSLGGAMADLFAIVDGKRFADLSGSDLAIVSLASPGIDAHVITEPAILFGYQDKYDHELVRVNYTRLDSIELQNPEWFSKYYFGFSHDRDRVYYAEEGETYLQETVHRDSEFIVNETIKYNENFTATTLNLPNITNGQVAYQDDYGQDSWLLPYYERGFGADHNGLIYWRNMQELTGSPLYAEYSADGAIERKIAFGVGTYASDQRWFKGGPIDDLGLDGLRGTQTGDFLLGLEGNDVLDAYAGDDLLDGGAGNDQLMGGSDDDSLFGGAGNDMLSGGYDVDYLMGGAGDDVLDGGTGVNTFVGGLGNDTYIIDSGSEFATITENAGEGTDTLEIAFQGSMIFAQTINLGGALDAIENATIAETVVVSTFGGSNPVNALLAGGGGPELAQPASST